MAVRRRIRLIASRHAAIVAGLAAFAAARCSRAPTPASVPITYAKDIAPILYANCAPCHRPGEVAPFSLLTYADASKHADGIADETRRREMPPWLPDRGEFPVVGERRLQDDQIARIQQWVAEGKPEGNPADAPAPPAFPEGWQLGKPDLVLTPARPYILKPGPDDVYRNFVLRTALPRDAYVRAVEFKTNGSPIHHAVIRVDPFETARRRDGQDGQPGFSDMGWQGVQDPEGSFLGWAPGRGPIVSPDGMPWRLDRGADLVVELHMIPSDHQATIQPTIALFLTDAPPARTPLSLKMSAKIIDIPAGARDHVVTDTYELPVPFDLMSVYPHAHYLARDMSITATLPDGTVKSLLHIPHWSFHWQQDYRYATPISLPAGARITMKYTYDNSEANGENPRRPPVRVRLGPKSTDEMAELMLQVMPHSVADAAMLVKSFVERDALANVQAAELRARESPDSAEAQAALGASYVEVGRHADAMAPLQAALRIDDRLANAHNDLGTALMALGRLPDALAQFQRAVALAPRDEDVHFNLANALKEAGRLNEAAAAYQQALAINPDFPEAHVNLGDLLFTHGRVKDALPHFQRAVELKPNSAVIHTDLSSVLAASGRYAEAMQHVRRALELNPEYPPALENFRRLQQMGIR